MGVKGNKNSGLNRRGFIKYATVSSIGVAAAQSGISRLHGAEQKKSAKEAEPKIKRYRTLGRTGFSVSDISIGAPWHEAILRNALDAGINYIDTAEAYHEGNSEKTIGKALKNRDRKKLFITTKLGLRGKESKETILKRARQCLERLQTDYIDCLMIWAASTVEIVSYPPFIEAVKQLKREGKVRFAGVASHGTQWRDEAGNMEKILMAAVNSGHYDVLLMVYNFLKKDMGDRLITACREKNIGVTLMKTNPVGNYYRAIERLKPENTSHASLRGFYKDYLPRFKQMADASQDFIKRHQLQNPKEISDAAIKFALSNPDAHTVLGSMDNFETMENLIGLSGQILTAPDRKRLSLYEKGASRFYCRHACGICESRCPKQVPINTIMRFNYYFDVKKQEKNAMMQYARLNSAKAESCRECDGHCESACPFQVPIRGMLAAAHDNLSLEPGIIA